MVNISENLEVLEGVKDDIKTAIENKGIVINDTTPFVDYATKINEISIGTGDYQDGYEQGKLDQKALLENRTFRRNGTYSRPDGYGTVVVDVPSGGTGGDCEEAYEQGKADQKALMTTATFTSDGTYTREDGWNEVTVKYNIFPSMNNTVLREFRNEWDRFAAAGEFWAADMYEYEQNNPDVTSNGMMYEIDYESPVGYYYDWKILNLGRYGLSIWGKKSLVTPWVYNANNSPSTRIILPDYFLGGFECSEVEYINRVFEGAESLKAILTLANLGKSFTSVNTLDLSVLTNLNDDYYDGDCFILLANSVYDFAVDGMNVNGISYSNVKLPTTVSQEAIDAWVAKGWRVLQ